VASPEPAGSIPSGPIDVNAATTDELESLPGVGPATAAAIVTERERNGPFLDVDDLDRVPGIGPAKLEALRGLVTT
jgi:competence protein ComEA